MYTLLEKKNISYAYTLGGRSYRRLLCVFVRVWYPKKTFHIWYVLLYNILE